MYQGFKYKFCAAVCFVVMLSSCVKDAQIGTEQSQTFIKFFGGSENDTPGDLINYNDGYAITGTMKTVDSAYQAFVILTDKFGNEVLTSPLTLGGKFDDIGNKIFVHGSGDLIMVGTVAKDINGNNTDVFVSRIGSNGSVVWEKNYGGNSKEEGLFGFISSSGNIVVGGFTESSGNGAKDVYILKLDNDGNAVWSSAIGGTGNDIGYDILEINNNLIIAGSTESFNFSNKKMDIFLVNVDNATGRAFDFRPLGDAINEKGIKLISLPDNDLLILGQAYDNTIESNRIVVYRTSNTFTVKWNAIFTVTDTYETGSDLFLYNNTLHILGTSYQNQNSDFLIHQMDVNGNIISSAPITSGGNQVGVACLADSDGNLLYVGSIVNSGYKQICFIKGLQH